MYGDVSGPANKRVEIFIYRKGHQIDSFRARTDATGRLTFIWGYRNLLQPHDTITYRFDGKQRGTSRFTRKR